MFAHAGIVLAILARGKFIGAGITATAWLSKLTTVQACSVLTRRSRFGALVVGAARLAIATTLHAHVVTTSGALLAALVAIAARFVQLPARLAETFLTRVARILARFSPYVI